MRRSILKLRIPSISEERRADLLSLLLLLLLPLIFFWRETLGWRALGDQDAVFWFFPAYKFMVEMVRQGQLPLWYPGYYSGVPLFALWQAGMLDPLNLIHFFGPTSRTLTLSFQLGFSIALLSTWSYGRQIGFTRRASIAAAIIYSLSGFMVARMLYPVFIHVMALAPLMLTLTEQLWQDPRWRVVGLGALVVAWQVFAAHPQPLVYSSLLVSAYAIFRAAGGPMAWRDSLRFLCRFAVVFILGAGLAAVQLFPAAEVAGRSVRQDWSYALFTFHSLHPVSLLTAVTPYFQGGGQGRYQMAYWGDSWHHNEQQIYLGILALALAAGGARFAALRRFPPGLFWIGVAVVGLLLSLGRYVEPLARLLFHLPVVGNFRGPHRHWMEVVLATAVLAGYAIDRMIREPAGRRRGAAGAIRLTAFLLLAIVAVVAVVTLTRPEMASAAVRSLPGWERLTANIFARAGREMIVPLLIGLLSAGALWLWTGRRSPARWVAPILALLLVDYYLYAASAPITHQPGLEQRLGQALPASAGAGPLSVWMARTHLLLTPGQGEFSPYWFAGQQMVTGYDPLLDRRYKTFSGIDEAGHTWLETILLPRDRTLDLLNTRYLILPPDWRPPARRQVAPIELAPSRSLRGTIDPAAGETLLIETRSRAAGSATLRLWCGEEIITEEQLPDRQPTVTFGPWLGLRQCREPLRLDLFNTGLPALFIEGLWLLNSSTGERRPFFHDDQPVDLDSGRWVEVAHLNPDSPYAGFRLFENRQLAPRVWLVDQVEPAWEGDQLKLIRGEIRDQAGQLFDPATTALVDMPAGAAAPWYQPFLRRTPSPALPPGMATVTSYQPDRLTISVEARRPALMVLAENADPGWQVSVDGQPASWHRVNFNLRGLVVTTGHHQVHFVYRPVSIKIGAVISLITALILLLVIVRDPGRESRRPLRGADASASHPF